MSDGMTAKRGKRVTTTMMCQRPRRCDGDRNSNLASTADVIVGAKRATSWSCGVVEEEKGLGLGLEGVVFQRLAREEGRCTVWAGLIRHAARGDGGMG